VPVANVRRFPSTAYEPVYASEISSEVRS
jgi:hypothetical protein